MGETCTSRTTRTQPSLNCETLTTMQRSIHLWTEELVVAISTFHSPPGESLQVESIFDLVATFQKDWTNCEQESITQPHK